MCALPPAWLWLLLGLLPLEIQARAVTLRSLSHRHRLGLSRSSKQPKSSPHPPAVPAVSDMAVTTDNHIPLGDSHVLWRALLHKEAQLHLSDQLLDQSNVLQEAPVRQHRSRGRRHANTGGGRGHSHLMRVGCVLGTCQVQNLSHRLYQLIGQSGREDSSPINPRSPHSYG
ncbi:unnamed protein product [Pleuronectes platessa]|uniref:Adrenomedullin 2 n=1 Tax=Pleuronectes platessa TaxID=8262 RepID=A0A9N7UR89_PLEPL|nr:protein bassoon [Pleuronectes platessa]CAB1435060.1 unnamed protein product [Pleuronectes platessa]